MLYRKLLTAACALALAATCALAARAAGGEIAGTVTDPRGSVVAGAQVTATDAATQKASTATTDSQGRYKISGLGAGAYTVAVTAQGFEETRVTDVKVEDGKTATANVQMRLPAVEGDMLSARITQSGVSDNFAMRVQARPDFGKG